jgi:hypothetical protein
MLSKLEKQIEEEAEPNKHIQENLSKVKVENK